MYVHEKDVFIKGATFTLKEHAILFWKGTFSEEGSSKRYQPFKGKIFTKGWSSKILVSRKRKTAVHLERKKFQKAKPTPRPRSMNLDFRASLKVLKSALFQRPALKWFLFQRLLWQSINNCPCLRTTSSSSSSSTSSSNSSTSTPLSTTSSTRTSTSTRQGADSKRMERS